MWKIIEAKNAGSSKSVTFSADEISTIIGVNITDAARRESFVKNALTSFITEEHQDKIRINTEGNGNVIFDISALPDNTTLSSILS